MSLSGEVVDVNGREFHVPTGFQLQLIAGPDLVPRPMVGDFDMNGDLYVADSSGSNDDVETQLREKPHRILKLSDTDNDGLFDSRTVYADHMMFPEGVMFHDGSVFVSAPPQIWQLTDADGDGVAEQREVWFDGKTLTTCANDLHGPYLGPDGWVYWCKGGSAEQTYTLPNGREWSTRAAHIYRRHVNGGPVESVMTGGMDNPIDVVFTPAGERIFSATFLQHPSGGRRDGLIHAIYGGVYGKSHGALDGHPRTGNLMPVLSHMGAAAPCGLTRLDGDLLGDEFDGNLLSCAFNLHQVTRHVLTKNGASFRSDDSAWLATPDIDFHPTDVLQDADGSVVVIDTGGWYKLCCPTSQLHKPDVLGGIYRVSPKGGKRVVDARGLQLDWKSVTDDQLIARLDDPRPAVRSRSVRHLAQRGTAAIPVLRSTLSREVPVRVRNQVVWAACQIEGPEAVAVLIQGLDDQAARVRQSSLHAISVRREKSAAPQVTRRLADDDPAVRRAAAEAVGRLGHDAAIPELLRQFARAEGRVLEHSLTFALIEIGNSRALKSAWDSADDAQRAAILMALDQIPGHSIDTKRVLSSLWSADPRLRRTALWVAERHPERAKDFAERFIQRLNEPAGALESDEKEVTLLAKFAEQDSVQRILASVLGDPNAEGAGSETRAQRRRRLSVLIRVLRNYTGDWLRPDLQASLAQLLAASDDPSVMSDVVSALSAHARRLDHSALVAQLRRMAERRDIPTRLRLRAINALGSDQRPLPDDLFRTALRTAIENDEFELRRSAVTALAGAKLRSSQLDLIIDSLAELGPVELGQLVMTLKQTDDPLAAERALEQLGVSEAFVVVPDSMVRESFAHFDATHRQAVDELLRNRSADYADKAAHLTEILGRLPAGEIRRGQQVFHSTKAACFTCHEMGYRGGDIGPDLTRIGKIRSRRDLLEAIVFPSLSFVRSYEPLAVTTKDGITVQGVVKDENDERLVLVNDQRKIVEVARNDIEEAVPGQVSVMPSGLDQLLTDAELADLLAFLAASQ